MFTNNHWFPTSCLSLAAGSLTGVSRKVPAKQHPQALLAIFLAVITISCDEKQTAQNTEARPGRLQTVIINNIEPRRDVTGQIIDAHGGCLQHFEGRYYLYGTAFGTNESSMAMNCPFRVYSSPDLERWTYEGELLKDPPRGVYTRPCVVFNPHTHKYVLWYNWLPKLWDSQTAVATSDTPIGPFTIINPNVRVFGSRPGDGSLFVDDDGTGYYIYTAIGEGYAVRVERLTPDYLGPIGEMSTILVKGGEAPVLFRRNNLYYALCGPLCPDCLDGSLVQVLTSASPLGPYNVRSNINRRPENGVPIIPAQETWVARIPMSGEPLFIWMADRWGSCTDGIKGHDFQFWSAPLKFSQDGDILAIENIGRWDITWAWGN
ncbi:MAG: family 43 glycosylhydrolase [Verrucomicrobiota bacterium]|jgi:hypothetical protein